MISLTIEAADVDQLKMRIRHLASDLGGVPIDVVAEHPQPAPQKRHRRTKAEIAADEAAKNAQPEVQSPAAQAAVAENTASEPAASPPAAEDVGVGAAEQHGAGASSSETLDQRSGTPAAVPLTLDAVRDKLRAVNAKKGVDEVKRILAAHGLQKVSAITEDKFAAIAAEADKVCA